MKYLHVAEIFRIWEYEFIK